MNAVDYIRDKGFSYQIKTGQIILKTCPFCGDHKNHFYMEQEEGAFYCHKCQERGNLINLQKYLGDYEQSSRQRSGNMKTARQGAIRQAFPEQDRGKVILNPQRAVDAHTRLRQDPEALRYMTETRGISEAAIDHFKIGLEVDQFGKWLTIPHYQGGKLVNIKSRSLPPAEKDFRRVKDCRSILFNSDILKEKPDTVFICEGELDAITLYDQGIKDVIGITAGAGAFLPEWIDQLQGVGKIILCFDSDEAGQKGAREAARRLGYDRCFNVILSDGQDVNDYFKAGHDVFEFQNLINHARRFDVQGVTSFQDCLDLLQRERTGWELSKGLMTGIVSIDRTSKRGMRDGELWVIASPPGLGKTSLGLQITSNISLQGIPALFFSMEMGIDDLTEKIIQAYTRTENIGFTEIEKTRDAFEGRLLYLGRCYQKPSLDAIMNTLKAAIRRYGLRLLCFDHLHFLVRSIANQTQEVSLAVQAFKLLAEEMEIPIILIVQPRKTDLDKPMTAADLKDSSSIHSDADYIIIMHRNRLASCKVDPDMETKDKSLDPVTLIRFEKARYGRGGECLLYFHGEYSRFDELKLRSENAARPQRKDIYD